MTIGLKPCAMPDPTTPLVAAASLPTHLVFQAVAERRGDATALLDVDRRLSYADLAGEAAALAARLRQLGVGPFQVVAIQARRSAGLAVAMLAVWSVDAAILVLDPAHPPLWRGRLLDAARPAAMIACVRDGGGPEEMAVEAMERPRDFRGVAGVDFAYVAATSGTTGLPRAILGGHLPLAHFLQWQRRSFGVGPGTRVAMLSGLAHDPLLRDVFAPLTSGATLVVPTDATLRDPRSLGRWLSEYAIDHVHWTPSLASALVDGWEGMLPALRRVFFGGECLSQGLIEAVRRAAPNADLFNFYGATETPQGVSCAVVSASGPDAIGPGIPGVQILVVDQEARQSEIGALGEIAVRSPYLAHGYLDDIAATQARFVKNPATGREDDRLYLTGDLGRARSDGHVDFVGRSDGQIKRGGVRIELTAIEGRALAHPSVRAAAAISIASHNGLVVLFVVARDTPADLTRWLADALTTAQRPDRVWQIDAIPLTPSGKADARALEKTFAARIDAEPAGGGMPIQTLERLARQVLGLATIAADDDLLSLGMHSLQALSLLGEIRRVFAVDVTVSELRANSTLRELDALILGRRPSEPRQPAPIIAASPVSAAQAAIWLAERLGGRDGALHIPVLLDLRGPLGDVELARHVNALQRRQPALRTVFWDGKEGLEQSVLEATIDLSVEPCSEGALRMRAEASIRERFDLVAGPLHRPLLLRVTADHAVLVWTFHHAIFDGASRTLLVREMAARLGGAQLADLSQTPLDLARAERAALIDPSAAGLAERYAARLSNLDALSLARAGDADEAFEFRLDEQLSAAVRRCASEQRTTPFAVMLGVYELLLTRTTGAASFAVGAPRSMRTLPQDQMLGCFADMMVVRADVDLGLTFAAHLRRVIQEHATALEEGRVPFEQVRAAFRRACPNRPFPCEAVLVLEDARADLQVGPVSVIELDWWKDRLRYGLELHFWPARDGFGGRLLFGSDFGKDKASWFVEAFQRALEQCCNAPETLLADCLLNSPEERARLVALGSSTDVPGLSIPLVRAIDEHAARTPGRVAVRYRDHGLSYGELVERSNALAQAIVDRGVVPGARVAIWLPQGVDRIVAALAVLRAGACYVPLEDDEAQARRDLVLGDVRPDLMISDRTCGALPRIDVGARSAAVGPTVAVAPGSDAYIIYTSGSSGRPKGVSVSRENLDRLFGACEDWLRAGPADVWACCHSFAFDFSVWEIWGALRHGGCVALAAREDVRDCDALLAFLARERISILSQTPSSFRRVVDACAGSTLDLGALRLIVFGGEALHPRVLRSWIEARGDTRPVLVNMYGITETTVHVTRRRIAACDLNADGSPIGRAIGGATVRVLDVAANLAPIGVPGEIFVGGTGVAGGYVDHPALTAERFVPDPWSERPGARLYRSGDQGMLLADGDVLYLGRLDDQVQLRGVRVELGEVEAALRSHPAVSAAAALVQSVADDDQRLVAYVTAAADAPAVEDAELTRHLARRLPGGVTAQVVWVDALPLTANGKVDRAALASRRLATPDRSRGGFEARSLGETLVAETFRDVLGIIDLPADADFFALGGHSLLATRMIARLRAVLGVDLPLGVLFENPTVSGIARAAQAALDRYGEDAVEPISPYRGKAMPPASFAQQRIWFAHQENRGLTNCYNSRLDLDIAGPLDRAALERALATVVARHEPLRTCLSLRDGEVRQRVLPPSSVPVRFEDLSRMEAVARQVELEEFKTRHYETRFDLETDSMVRFCLVRLAPEHHLLLTTFHHCAYDGRSSQIFLNELARFYDGNGVNPAPVTAKLPLRYVDYAAWEHRRVRSEAVQAHILARSRVLRGVKPFRLPAEADAAAESTLTGRVDRALPATLCTGAAALARTTHCTTFTVLLSALTLLLHRLSGESEITLGIASANRSRGEVNDLIGMFVNLVTVTAEIMPEQRFVDLLGSVRSALLDALDHQDVPFERLVEAVNPERRSVDTPLVQVIAAFHPWAECADVSVGATCFSALPESDSHARFDLEFHFWPGIDGTMLMRTIYSRARFSERAIGLYLDRLDAIMDACLRDPHSALGAGSSADATVHAVAARPSPSLPAGSIVDLFDARAAEGPDRAAVIDGLERWSYARLQGMSARIASRLQDCGVGRGDIVAVAAPRSAWVVAALLGILRAGAAYLPIDPDTPADWQSRLTQSARLALVADSMCLAGMETQIVLAEASFPMARLRPVAIAHEDLAYVSATSGSTGAPSGVMIPHRGILHLVADMRYGPIAPGDRVAHVAALAFDATTFELWGALAHGATVVVVPRETALDPAAFAAVIRDGIDAMFLTTSLFNRLAEDACDCFDRVATLLVGGEAVDGRLLARVRPARLANVYGPTECTTFATWQPVGPSPGPKIPIGRALPFAQAHVLDGSLLPVPVGIAGELCVGGAGLAWGYLGDPRKTAERFVPNAYASQPGARLYRTGDRVRRDAEGMIDFLGRMDRQVKVRGFRIEPAAIESELQQHPEVSRAIVAVSDEGARGLRLSAFVVPRGGRRNAEGVAGWEAVFDEKVYRDKAGTLDPLFDTRGWLDSRTGQAIPEVAMRDWAEDLARTALARAPRRVLDIGCGLGIHLFRLAPFVDSYQATDVSQAALDQVAARLALIGEAADRVRLSRCAAHRVEDVAEGNFDLIQIVSVAQYFPSVDYLRQVIEAAARLLAPGGTILVGDVRSLPLLRTFHSWVVAANAAPGQSLGQQRTEVERRLATERELAVDPRFFEACVEEIPNLDQVRIALSGGERTNELTLFRYTVELRRGVRHRTDPRIVEGGDLGIDDLHRLLAAHPTLLLRDVPNVLAQPALSGEVRHFPELGRPRSGELDRATIRRVAAEQGLSVELSWPASGERDRIDVAFAHTGGSLELPHGRSSPAGTFANRPVDPSLASRLRDFLAARLPSYALPSSITVVNHVPLTPTGKIDRSALRVWDQAVTSTAFVGPEGPIEELLCLFWAETLGGDRVGVTDDFFELGGHSLLAIRLVELLRRAFGAQIPLGWMFEHPTARAMANALVGEETTAGATLTGAQAYLALSRLSDEDLEALEPRRAAVASATNGRR